jgi:hypothetical protein
MLQGAEPVTLKGPGNVDRTTLINIAGSTKVVFTPSFPQVGTYEVNAHTKA